jgi:Phospholipase/Carboxylesterase/Secretion system C-terminal sorting domain
MKEFYRFSSMGLLCLSLSLFLSSRALSQVQTPRFITTSANSNGFYEYLPAGYNTGSQTYPLMIFVHGDGELGNGGSDLPKVLVNGPPKLINNGQFPSSFTVNGNTYSFIVISPQFMEWPDATHVDAVINYAIAHYRVDVNRVYITGLSMGGAVAWGYPGTSAAFASKIAAILPISGAIGINDQFAQNIASANIPVYATHNIDDPTVPYTFTVANVNAVNFANPPPTIKAFDTIFPAGNGHDAWTKTYDPAFLNPRIGNLNVYQWMLQFAINAAPPVTLPITLVAFTAALSADQSEVAVDWTTGIEQNNKYFILQRSPDANQFRNLDTIPSAAPQGGGHSYTYTDASPLPGNNFYRLEQVDGDGKPTFYSVLQVNVATATGGKMLQLSPNPTSGIIYLELVHPETGPLQVSLSDVQGKILRVWNFQKQGLIWDQSLDLGNIATGTYFLKVRGTTLRETRTFIKK